MQRYSDSVILAGKGSLQAMAGARVYVYHAGTSTLATIYSDNGSTEQSNPLTAGSDGEYSFFAADGLYDIQAIVGALSDVKRGVQLWGAGVSGAVGDGVTDDTAAIQAALTDGGDVMLPAATYRVTAQLVMQSNQTLTLASGAVLSWADAAAGGIYAAGTVTATTTLAANAAKGATEISVTSAAGIAAGALLRVWSESVFDAGRTDSWCGELVYVADVSGTDVTLRSALCDAYLTADTASVEVISPVSSVRVQGGTLVGPTASNNGVVGVQFYRAVDCRIDGVRTERFDSAHIRFRDAINCVADGCSTVDVITSSTGYGVSFMDAAQDCRAINMRSEDCRHAVTTNNSTDYGGIPRRCEYADSVVAYTARASLGVGTGGDALDTHAAAEDIAFRRVHVVGATMQGVNIECPTATVEDCVIIGPQSHGIGVHNETTRMGRVTIRWNKIFYPGRSGDVSSGDGIKISSGNNASAVGYERISVVGNEVTGCPLNHVRFGVDDTRTVESGFVSDNVLDARGSGSSVNQVLYATNSHNLSIVNNKVFADVATQSGYRLTSCDNLRVLDNVAQMADSSTAAAVWIDGTSARPVVGRVAVVAASASSLDGIVIGDDVTSALVLSGNDLADCNVTITRGAGTSHYIDDAAQPFSTTISGGAIAVYYDTRLVTVDTEAAAASDDLDTISGGTAGQIIVVQSAGNARDIVAKNGTGNLRLGADKTLDNTRDKLALLCTGSEWHLIALGDNGA